MGLFGKTIGETKNDTKLDSKEKQIRDINEIAHDCLNYAKKNFVSICERTSALYSETSELIDKIKDLKSRKLSRDERRELSKANEEASEKLEYLYLCNDYFTFLTRLSNGMALKNEQILLIIKFTAFFVGIQVLSVEDEEDDEDDPIAATFMEIGRDFKEISVSIKRSLSNFGLREYVEELYCEELDNLKLPKIEKVVDVFEKVANKEKPSEAEKTTKETYQEVAKTIECPNCHSSLPETAKFCSKCGTKIEVHAPSFCMECGSPLRPDSKFCPKCGSKINK